MKLWKKFALSLVSAVMVSGCNSVGKAESPDQTKAAENQAAKKDSAEVMIPVAQQSGVIEVQKAELRNEPEVISAPGKIALNDRATWRVGVRTDGMVMVVNVGLGDYVRKDQLLARYHADEVRDTRALYRTALSEHDRAEAAVAQAQRNYDRAQRLLDLKFGSIQEVEMARQNIRTAETELKNAQIEIDRTKDLLEDDLRVPADPPAGSDETVDQVPIRAPASGYIIEKNVTPGKTIERNTDTFVIGDLSHVWMIASINENNISKVHVGQRVGVTVNGFANERFTGRVVSLGEEFDPVTRSMKLRIDLANPAIRLRPEMLAIAQIEAGSSKPQLIIPFDAVQQVNEQDVVFIKIAEDRFEVRAVHVSEPINGRVTVLDGLKPDEAVVTRGSFIVKSQLLKSSLESE